MNQMCRCPLINASCEQQQMSLHIAIGVCVCRLHSEADVWAPLCQAWDSAIQMLCRTRGVQSPFDFRTLMDGHIAHQLLKPVRARCAFLFYIHACHLGSKALLQTHKDNQLSLCSPVRKIDEDSLVWSRG